MSLMDHLRLYTKLSQVIIGLFHSDQNRSVNLVNDSDGEEKRPIVCIPNKWSFLKSKHTDEENKQMAILYLLRT